MPYVLGCRFYHDSDDDDGRLNFVDHINIYTDKLSMAVRFATYADAEANRGVMESICELDEESGEIELAVDPHKGKA